MRGEMMTVVPVPTERIGLDSIGPDSLGEVWRMDPSAVLVVWAVTRRMVPYLIEATLIPTALFYTFFITLGLMWAVLAALGWTLSALLRRMLTGQRVPGLLVLAMIGISVRTTIFLFNENHFVYFFQPIMRTMATGVFLALSVAIGRPLIARFAADFCPLDPDVECRPAVQGLFRRLTFLWAGVNGVAAAVTLTLLLTLPVGLFVGTATVSAWIITSAGVVLTVSDSVRTARAEGLSTAIGPNGRLHAHIAT
jgi:hypothetical protein